MDEARRLVRQAADKNCALDPAPTWIVKKFVNELSPFITVLLNASTKSGQFPSSEVCQSDTYSEEAGSSSV